MLMTKNQPERALIHNSLYNKGELLFSTHIFNVSFMFISCTTDPKVSLYG